MAAFPSSAEFRSRVADGEFVGVLGHNGMGKTTLLKTLMGFFRPPAARCATTTRTSRACRRMSGRGGASAMFRKGARFFRASAYSRTCAWVALRGHGREESAIEPILAEFPRLKPLLDRLGGALSGGEQQLLAIARCLCGGPKLVLLDEPTEGIQPSIIEEIVERLQALRLRYGLTIVLVEQNLDFIQALSHRVLIMHKGRITREVTAEEIADPDMLHEFVGMAG